MAKAKRFYPPRDDSDEEPQGVSLNLPLLLARVEALDTAGDAEEESEKEASN